jgi:polyisoprenoid-binding protein YceI
VKFKSFLIAILTVAALPLFADTYNIDKQHSEASFQVRHFVTQVRGKFDDFSGAVNIVPGKPAESSVEFHIKAASINTGVADRDNHLRSVDFFDVANFPEITFKSTSIKAGASKDAFDVTGDLTMHGVTKRITIPVTLLGYAKDPWGNERAGFSLETTLNRQEYGIKWNKALDAGGMMLSDDVKVSINLESVKKK